MNLAKSRPFFGRMPGRTVQTGVRCWICWAQSSCMPFRWVAECAGWFNEQRAESTRGRDMLGHFLGPLEKSGWELVANCSVVLPEKHFWASALWLRALCARAPTEILELGHSLVKLNPKRSLLPSLLPETRNKPKSKPVWYCHFPYLIYIFLNQIKLDFQMKDCSGAWRSVATTGRGTWTFRNFPTLFQNDHFLMMQQLVHWG